LYKLYSLYSDYNEQIEKINAEHVREKAEVFDLARQYTELGKAIDNASSKEQNYSRTDAIEKKRVIIEKLIKSLNDKGFDIKLNVLGLNEHELDETFRTLQAKLLQFQDLLKHRQVAWLYHKVYQTQFGKRKVVVCNPPSL
jgi:hypothetical protein